MLLAAMTATIRKYRMFERGQTVLVAVSGGPDSLALLDGLLALAPELGLGRLAVAHLDHGIRSDSAADAAFVAAFAAERDLECYSERVDLPALLQGSGESPEAVAREVRYAFLERAAEAAGADRVALGHNADDQAETVVMRLLRGAGADGLSGIPPVRLPYVRPLIETPRAEIEAYCRDRGLKPRLDSTNADPSYLRNRVRHQLMPVLRGHNPRLTAALGELAERMRADAVFISERAEEILARCQLDADASPGDGGGGIVCRCLVELPDALQRAVLRTYYQRVTGAPPLGFQHVERLRELMRGDSGAGRHQLPGGVFARCEGGRLVISPLPGPAPEFAVPLLVPGLTPLPTGEIVAAWLPGVSDFDWTQVNARKQAFLDRDACGAELVIRNRRPGDRIRPTGLGGEKKLQDLLVDAKVPRWARDRLPLLAAGSEILWVPGLRVSERVRVTPTTTNVLALQQLRAGESRCSGEGNMLE